MKHFLLTLCLSIFSTISAFSQTSPDSAFADHILLKDWQSFYCRLTRVDADKVYFVPSAESGFKSHRVLKADIRQIQTGSAAMAEELKLQGYPVVSLDSIRALEKSRERERHPLKPTLTLSMGPNFLIGSRFDYLRIPESKEITRQMRVAPQGELSVTWTKWPWLGFTVFFDYRAASGLVEGNGSKLRGQLYNYGLGIGPAMLLPVARHRGQICIRLCASQELYSAVFDTKNPAVAWTTHTTFYNFGQAYKVGLGYRHHVSTKILVGIEGSFQAGNGYVTTYDSDSFTSSTLMASISYAPHK